MCFQSGLCACETLCLPKTSGVALIFKRGLSVSKCLEINIIRLRPLASFVCKNVLFCSFAYGRPRCFKSRSRRAYHFKRLYSLPFFKPFILQNINAQQAVLFLSFLLSASRKPLGRPRCVLSRWVLRATQRDGLQISGLSLLMSQRR